jgi:hypothetical protein
MKWVPSSGLLNFLAGVLASASAALLVSIPLDPERISPLRLVIAALPWGIAAGLVAYTAAIVEAIVTDVNLSLGRRLTEKERQEVRAKAIEPHEPQIRRLLMLSGGMVVVSVGTLIILFDARLGTGVHSATRESSSVHGATLPSLPPDSTAGLRTP